MHVQLKNEFWARIEKAKVLLSEEYFDESFSYLEEAHVLGQKYTYLHTISHYWMLRLGLKKRDINEVWGQILRLALGAVGSLLGIYPKGNTGGANLSLGVNLPIAEHLQKILDLDK